MISVVKKLLYIFDRKQKTETIGMLVMILIGTAFELLGVASIRPLIVGIMSEEQAKRQSWYWTITGLLHITDYKTFIIVMMIGLSLIYIVKNLYLLFMYKCQYQYLYSNMRKLSIKMMRSYLDRPYSFFLKHSSSELLRNVDKDTGDFFGVIRALLMLMTEGCVVAAIVIYLFIQDKSITIAVGLMLSVFAFLIVKVYRVQLLKVGKRNRYYQTLVYKWVQQAFGGIKEVKVMNKEDFFYDSYDKAFQGRVQSEYTYHTMVSIPKPIIEAVMITSLLGAAGIKILHGTHIEYFVPVFSQFIVAAYRMLPSFNRLTEYIGSISYQKPAVDAIYANLKDIEEQKIRLRTEEVRKDEMPAPLPFNDKIDIQDLSFHYEGSDKLVLENVRLTVRKNTSVAFIGASGAGKTTLADLILGVLTPVHGKILADDADIQQHLDRWHRTIGYIPQSIYLLDDTIAANIAFGVPAEKIDRERVQNAIDKAQLHDTVAALPDGMMTEVGERGIRLSGGQRQRIGIARALYTNPDILILDEATSALDNETETAVMESIDALHGEMTLIIIAHRLTTIRNCDIVYRIEDGQASPVSREALMEEISRLQMPDEET